MEDPRKIGLKNGLRQLTLKQLRRVKSYNKPMILDEFNYQDGKFCPLAVALELDKTVFDPTNNKVFDLLIAAGYKIYNTRGIKGNFYTTDRERDLRQALDEVILEKQEDAALDI